MDDKEAMVRLRDNLSRATTKTAIVESFYAVTQTAAQNLAVSDAVAALETLAKLRASLRALCADPFDVLIDAGREVLVIRTDEVQALLEAK